MKDKILVNLSEDANHTFESSDNIIGREGEDGTTRLEITIPEKLIGCSVYLDFEKPDGEKLKTLPLNTESGKAVYDVDGYLLTKYGEIKVQAVLTTSDGKIWKSSKKKYHIQKSINADGEIPDKEGFIDEANKILEELSKLVELTKGVGIESIEYENSYTSNDGKIVDIYKINLTDGKKQTFEVTNGKDGKDGEKGEKGNLTIDGRELNFFIGTQDEYDELTDAEKENLFAIIEDDDTAEEIDGLKDDVVGLKEDVEGLKNGNGEQKQFALERSYEFADKYISYREEIEIGTLPIGKTVDDIIGCGIEMHVDILKAGHTNDSTYHRLYFSAIRVYPNAGGFGENDEKVRLVCFGATATAVTKEKNIATVNIEAEIFSYIDDKNRKLYIRFNDAMCYVVKEDDAGAVCFSKYDFSMMQSIAGFRVLRVSWLFA